MYWRAKNPSKLKNIFAKIKKEQIFGGCPPLGRLAAVLNIFNFWKIFLPVDL